MRRSLDLVYDLAGWLAAAALVALFLVVLASIGTRLVGMPFPGSTDYAGYLMATASFLAMAHTLRHGAHIRVELIEQALPARGRHALMVAATVLGAGMAWYLAWFSVRVVQVSRMLGDVSQGQDATPLWLPQLVMAGGSLLLATALTDRLVTLLRGGRVELPPADGAERPIEG